MPEFEFKVAEEAIKNKNYLYPTRFRFTLEKAPKAIFFATSAPIPGIDLSVAKQSTGLGRDIPTPGSKLTMDPFDLRFLVDEDMTNYAEVNKWLRGLGAPESLQQSYDLQNSGNNKINPQLNMYSDGTLQILNSNDRVNLQIKYYQMFPFSLTPLVFDSAINKPDPFTAIARFHYTYFEILDKNGNLV